MSFDTAVDRVIRLEGGYVNDPSDPGGETKYGISKRSYPHLDITNLTLAQAKSIYYQDYWTAAGLGSLPAAISDTLLHFCVNMGNANGIKLLQRAVNTYTLSMNLAKPTTTISVDGGNGPITQASAKLCEKTSVLVDFIRAEAANYYQSLSPELKRRYLHGWLNGI